MKIISQFIKYIFIRYAKVRKKTNKGNPKYALLSFIVHPYFTKSKGSYHPNVLELRSIVSSLNEFGYSVDIVDYRRKKISGKYDLVIGFGDCYEYAIKNRLGRKYILYSTGSPSLYQNQQSIKSLRRLSHCKLVNHMDNPLNFLRITEDLWIHQLVRSDVILSIGNNYTRSLYSSFHDSVYSLPGTYFIPNNENELDESNLEKKTILWFGGKGSIHKGLDLCIDAVLATDMKLYIAGAIDDEIHLYEETINKFPDNVDYLGLLDINSDKFREIAGKVPFVILPSCSEGMATSILTMACNFGTIPIISKQCGVDILSSAIEIESLTAESVANSLEIAMNLSLDDIIVARGNVLDCYSRKYPPNGFEVELHANLQSIINN